MGTWLRQALDILTATALFVLLIAWCIGCMSVPLWLVTTLPIGGMAERVLAVLAVGGGLWFALWVAAKLTKSRI